MPRIARRDMETCFYHVLVQGINKSYIFNKRDEILYYIKLMYELKEEYEIRIIAYCIMNNHAHLLVNVEKVDNLSSYMHKLNMKYAIFYNKKYNRVGYVFRNRYKSEGIYGETHLYNCVRYIYNNPVKAKICKKPGDYEFSNYKECRVVEINGDKYSFIDTFENIDYNEIICDFLKENNISKDELIYNKEKLKELVIMLRKDFEVSYRIIEDEIGISRETLRRLVK